MVWTVLDALRSLFSLYINMISFVQFVADQQSGVQASEHPE